MTDPVTFVSTTPRFAVPLLFTGQAQKELTVNEAFALADALLHLAVEGEAASPPVAPVEGDCWLIHPSASGDWTGYGGRIACRQSSTWLYIAPRDGMRAYNRASGQDMFYAGSWRTAPTIPVPTGGTIIDSEARAAISGIVSGLVAAGIISAV